jgi:hypothetical protein
VQRSLLAVLRIHQKQIVDFTPGRPHAARGRHNQDSAGLPRSRWVLAQGPSDQIVVWFKPKKKPA